MRKTLAILMILVLLAIFALSALSLVMPVGKGPIIPHPPIIELREALDAASQDNTPTTATTQLRGFFFSMDALEIGETGNDFVAETEGLISEIMDIFPPAIRFTDIDRINVITNRELFRAGSVFSPWEEGVTISRHSQHTMGWLAHTKSGNRLPMWLSVGIEAIARCNLYLYGNFFNNIGTINNACPNCTIVAPPPDSVIWDSFGDSLFAPVSWGRAAQTDGIGIAYRFTRFLIEEGYFAGLVSYYMDENWAAGERLSTMAYYRFTGRPGLTPYRLIITQEPDYAYAIAVQTDMAAYRFIFDSFNQGLEFQLFSAYVDYMDDGILFAVGWYRNWVDFDFYPIEVNVFYRQSKQNFYAEAHYPWLINIYEIGNFPPTSISHEASHLLTTRVLHDHGYIFTPFDEGLAFAVMAYHGIHDRPNHGFEYQFRRGRESVSTWRLNQKMGRNGASVIRNILGDFDIIGLFHIYAYLEHRGYINGINLNFWSRTDMTAMQYADIYIIGTFGRAASFVLYLIETYGADAYMQVHFDLARFEYVYGVQLYEKIDSWIVFLEGVMGEMIPQS